MRKIYKNTSLALLAALAAVLVILIISPWIIGQERLRRLAEELASEHAGLQLHIAEPLQVRLLFRPSLVLEGVTMHLTHGATTAGAPVPLLQVERLSIVLALLPLVSGDIEVVKMELQRPVLHLLRNQEGRWNWQTQPAQSESRNEPLQEVSPVPTRVADIFAPLRSLNLHIIQGRVHVQDLARNATLDLQQMQLELQGRMQQERFVMDSFSLSGELLAPQLPWDKSVPLTVAATASYAPKTGQLVLDVRNASLQHFSLAGGLEAHHLLQSPEVQGNLFLSAPVAAVPGLLPRASGLEGGGSCSLNATFRGPLQELELPSLVLALRELENAEEMILKGRGRLRLADTTAVELALQGTRLDLTPFFANSPENTPQSKPWPLPQKLLAWTENLALDMSLQLDALQLGALTLRQLQLHTVTQPGELRLSGPDQAPLAKLADGELQAELRASLQHASLNLAAEASLQGGDALQLLAPLAPEPMLQGATSAQLSLKTQGRDWPSLATSLQGSLTLDIQDGVHISPAEHAAKREFSLLEGKFTLEGVADVPEAHSFPQPPTAPEDSLTTR